MNRKILTARLALAACGLLGIASFGYAGDCSVIVESGCADGCGAKVCRPVVETRKVGKRVYDDICEDFCLPRCSLFSGLFGHKNCCDEGHCAACGNVRTKKYLIVKIRNHEECVNKCVVEQACCQPAAPCCVPATGIPAAVPLMNPPTAPRAMPAPSLPSSVPQTQRPASYQPAPVPMSTPDTGALSYPPVPLRTNVGQTGYQPMSR